MSEWVGMHHLVSWCATGDNEYESVNDR